MRARVPASAANLGPGFDVLGLALNRYVEVEVEPADELVVDSVGQGADWPDHRSHLAARVVMAVTGTDAWSITVRSEIPLSRGLGSSASLALAAAAAAGAEDPLSVAVDFDGHLDNASAAWAGGLVSAVRLDGRIEVTSWALDDDLAFVAVIPDRHLATAEAREVLPVSIPLADATFNVGRCALLLAGLADPDRLVATATDDRFHQGFRTALFPEAPALLAALVEGGALASCWSGAGPTLLGICRSTAAYEVAEAATSAMAGLGVAGDAVVLRADRSGLEIDPPEPLAV